MKNFAWLALPVTAALMTACGTTPAPGKIDSLSSPTPLELQSEAQGSGSFTFKNTGGSALTYSTTVTPLNGAPAWLNITQGASATVQPNATQTVKYTAICPKVSTTASYTANIALTVGSGNTAVTKTVTAALKCIAPITTNPVVVDTEKPVVTASSLGSVGVPRVTITGTATDNIGVTRVTYSLNGGNEVDVENVQAAPSVALNFTVQGLSASNTLTLRAYDAANNVSDVKTLSVTYAADATAPQIDATATPRVSKGSVTITGRITDEAGGSEVKAGSANYVLLDSANQEVDVDVIELNADGSFSVQLAGLAQNHYSLRINATDNNDNPASATVEFKVDTTKPLVNLTSLVPNSNSFTATGTASDAFSGLATVRYEVVTLDTVKTVVRSGDATLSSSTYSFSAQDLPDGSYTVRLIATDQAGNTAVNTKSITVSKDGPVIVLNEILPNNGSFTFSGSITDMDLDPASAAYTLVDSSNATVKQGSLTLGGGGSFSQTVTSLAQGRYTLTISAKDTSNNKNTSTLVVDITVDQIKPTITNLTGSAVRKNKVIVKGLVSFNATDDIEVGKVEYQVNSEGYKNVAVTTTGEYAVSFASKAKAGETITVTVRVTDTAGNVNTGSVAFPAPK